MTTDGQPEEPAASSQLLLKGATIMQVTHREMRAVSLQAPRDLDKVRDSIIEEIERVPAWAENGYYDRPVGDGKRVAGASVTLTRIIARNFGNCSVRSYLAGQSGELGDEIYQLSGVFMDLQTNVVIERMFPVSARAWRRSGDYVALEGEKLMQAILIGASKAERNAVSAGVPDWILQTAFERCRIIAADTIQQKLSATVQWFARRGIALEVLERQFDGTKLDKLDAEQLGRLKGLMNSLRDGELSPEDIIGRVEGNGEPTGASVTQTVEEVLGGGAKITGGRQAKDDTLEADLKASLEQPPDPNAQERAELEAKLAALDTEKPSPTQAEQAPTQTSNVVPIRGDDDDGAGF